jgi:unsaturated rhamnogalacturonyl hydrolase
MYRKYGDLSTNWAVLGANTLLEREPNINPHFKWEYEDGLTLNGLYEIYQLTNDSRYLDYIKHNIDQFVSVGGAIRGYNFDEYNLDHINNGKIVLDLYDKFKDTADGEKYKQAADLLYSQLLEHPRLNDGTFWHKKIYPYQCWLDGLYMGSVFYARYLHTFNITDKFDDVILQFTNAYTNTVDLTTNSVATGLCYHVYDEARQQPWANPQTGCSPHFWLRAIGWFVMSMIDVLEYLPQSDGRELIVQNVNALLSSLINFADTDTGLWYQIVDQGERTGNYLESSGSFMLIAALAKGLRLNYLKGAKFENALNKAWENAIDQFLTIKYLGNDIHLDKETQWVNVNKMCQMAGLGGQFPGRDGSFAYYIETPIVANDHKGYGPFLLASSEMLRRKL